MVKSAALYQHDCLFLQTLSGRLAGVDEAGRGPLAGPVVAGAVVLDMTRLIDGVNDSKKLTAASRDRLYAAITDQAVSWAVGLAEPEEIDRINILNASLLAMRRALEKLTVSWALVLVDGNRPVSGIDSGRQNCIVGGDAKSASVAAASIIAKVTRDRIMEEYDSAYPAYGFRGHKGYPTLAHRRLLQQHGMCAIHRRSFCHGILAQTSLALQETAPGD